MKIKNTEKKKPQKRPPKKITPTYLHNAGLYYLQRFSSSSENFRQVMLRKVKKSCMHHKDQDYEKCCAMVDDLVKKFESSELLNDELYTASKVNALRRQGKSKRAIITKLKSKGLPSEKILGQLQTHDEQANKNPEEAELMAALTFARKKRLGPFIGSKEIPYEKALASLARAGFNYETAQKTLKYSQEEAEELMLHRK